MSDLSTLDGWNEHCAYMESVSSGFWVRNPLRVLTYLGDPVRCYQFGYEIEGYGTVVGHCRNHKRHKTAQAAFECGQRFLEGKPPRWQDRLPWMKETRSYE